MSRSSQETIGLETRFVVTDKQITSQLGDESVMVVWTRDSVPELAGLLDYLDARDEDSGLEQVGAPWTARFQPSAADSSDFFAATLGGNAARVVVRDWYQSRFGVVKAAVRKCSPISSWWALTVRPPYGSCWGRSTHPGTRACRLR